MSEKLSPGGQTKGGGSQHWCTPPDLVALVHKVFGCAPDLDPFSNPQSVTGARQQWYGPELKHGKNSGDGFEDPWMATPADSDDPWRVFFNNPWGKTGKAVAKAEREWLRAGSSIEIIGLFPCSMNAKHWPLVEQAPARCYLNKRPNFMEDGEIKKGNPKDVAIVYWGSRPYRFADVFSAVGRIHFGRVE